MIAIRGGTVLTPTEAIDEGVVLIDGGVITGVGTDVEIPKGAEVIDAAGQVVMPGMIDAHCHTGVFNDGVGVSPPDTGWVGSLRRERDDRPDHSTSASD